MPKACVRREAKFKDKQRRWSFEPSFCRPAAIIECDASPEASDAYIRSMRSNWFEDMIGQPAHWSAPPVLAGDSTHDRLFGTEPPPVAVRRRPDAGDSCNSPRWSPIAPRPPSVDDFTRTHRNIHGDDHPELRPPAPADFNEPRTTILGPYPLPLVCCHHPTTSISPVSNEQFDRTKHNIIGPQQLPPLRFPARTDDFVNSKCNLFGPATTVPLRFPQRTSDFDDSKRNVFGPQIPFSKRPSLRPPENTFDHLFGKTILPPPPTVTPPPALRQNINVLSMTGRSHTPSTPRFKPRPEISFGNTYNHLFGRTTASVPKSEYRQELLPMLLSQ